MLLGHGNEATGVSLIFSRQMLLSSKGQVKTASLAQPFSISLGASNQHLPLDLLTNYNHYQSLNLETLRHRLSLAVPGPAEIQTGG